MSSGGWRAGTEEREFYRQRKLSSCILRRGFLLDCLEEQVLPKCAPRQISSVDKPFNECAKVYLREACNTLSDKIDLLREQSSAVILPTRLIKKLQAEESKQREKLTRKLKDLCSSSLWNRAGRVDLINNLSGTQLSDDETQVLSLGLKFDYGRRNGGYDDFLIKNYRWGEKDVDKGFKQGIITCYQALAEEKENVIPRRFRKALARLTEREDIYISQADKGGGIVIMKKTDYIKKMTELLSDGDTYKKVNKGYAKKEASRFNKKVRSILSKCNGGEKLLGLVEEAPRTPRMKGLPKTHKPGIPMRPITSGIGSAPHRLAKCLAKPLSAALGSISSAHLKNSSDLIDRIKKLDLTGKKMASFDVKALFTNVPVKGAMEAVERVLINMSDSDLPVNKVDYMKLVALCVSYGCFAFNDEEYVQHRGLAMGSPLSAVMSSLYMESLEKDRLLRVMGRGTSWFRYVDDVLAIMPEKTLINNKLRMLNKVNVHIKFTVEEETDGTLPFLDALIHRSGSAARFSVYRKPTNKDDYIHYLSNHDPRTKSGVVIGFFLRAFRICSEEYLSAECSHIVEAFQRLGYPTGLLQKLRKKAEAIAKKSNSEKKEEKKNGFIVVPYSKKAEPITRFLTKIGVNIVHTLGKRIGNNVTNKEKEKAHENSVVYEIPCGGCSKKYYGETGRGIGKRIAEHKNDLRHNRQSNSLVLHATTHGHLPAWNDAKALHTGLEKRKRKTIEAAYISTEPATNHREGFTKLAGTAAEIVKEAAIRRNQSASATCRRPAG